MATGGVANVLYQGRSYLNGFPRKDITDVYKVPYRFPGLYTIGCIFFITNICLFFFNVTMISLRFYFHPTTFLHSLLHPTESLFIPASVISIGTILINVTQYGLTPGKTGDWLLTTMNVLFWIYCGLAVVFSCGIYLIMYVNDLTIFERMLTYRRWSTQTFTVAQMTPVWIFPCYPLLVIGPHAGALAKNLLFRRGDALNVLIGGFVFQGIGFLLSLMIYAAFIYRLMTQKLPQENLRPGMFVSVGPSGFTISGLVTMGLCIPEVASKDFLIPGNGELAANISKVMAIWAGLWLWGLAIWFFIVSVGAHWSCVQKRRMQFAMTFYSYVFPNTALTTATFAIAKALENEPIAILGCVMTCIVSQHEHVNNIAILTCSSANRRLVRGLHHDDTGSHQQRHPLAAETRGPSGRWLAKARIGSEGLRSTTMLHQFSRCKVPTGYFCIAQCRGSCAQEWRKRTRT